MSVITYNRMKSISIHYNGDIWPNYHDVWEQKQFCRPPKNTVSITEIEANVPLKVLAELTFDRIGMIPNINHEFAKLKQSSGADVIPTVTLGFKDGTDT